MKSRRESKRQKSKGIFWIVGISTGLLLVLALGLGKHNHDSQLQKLYQDKVHKAQAAQMRAYHTRKEADIEAAQKLIMPLHAKEKRLLSQKLVELTTYLTQIEQAHQAVRQGHRQLSEQNLSRAIQQVEGLTAPYEQKDREGLLKQLEADKKVLEARQKEQQRLEQEQKKYAGRKLIALTFDDGPSPNTTPQLLKTLREMKVPVTFFPLGAEAQKYPELIKQEAQEGHEVASHTWDHKDLVTLAPEEQKQEIEAANHLINQITGQKVTLFRPPYGSYNATVLGQTDLTAVNWTVDTNDWRFHTSDPVVQNALSAAHDGAIILLHDIHPWSVEAVPQIIQELRAQGYCFVKVSTLLEIQNGSIQPHKVYFGD